MKKTTVNRTGPTAAEQAAAGAWAQRVRSGQASGNRRRLERMAQWSEADLVAWYLANVAPKMGGGW